jgi:hypothetical protein
MLLGIFSVGVMLVQGPSVTPLLLLGASILNVLAYLRRFAARKGDQSADQ